MRETSVPSRWVRRYTARLPSQSPVEAAKIDELFVLSDGQPTVGVVTDTEALLRLVREANKYSQIRIHCVFTGTGSGAALLRSLAEQNGGVFVQR